MTSKEAWKKFTLSGSIIDYLNYAKIKKAEINKN